MPGNGICKTSTGLEGTARHFIYDTTVSHVRGRCDSDSQCVAFAFAPGSAWGIVYSPKNCTRACNNLSWQDDPSLIVKAENDPYNNQWEDGTCYKKKVFTGEQHQREILLTYCG